MSRPSHVVVDRIVTGLLVAIVGGGLLAAIVFGTGCQASTRVQGAESKAERTTSDNRGVEEWEVIVEPAKAVRP